MRNMNLLKIVGVSIIFLVLYSGCDVKSIEQTLYLGNCDVTAPINTPPIHVSTKSREKGSFVISPKIALNSNNRIEGKTENRAYSYQPFSDSLKKLLRENNLNWSFPEFLIGADFDYATSKSVALFGGIQFSNVNNRELLGGEVGFGFFGINDYSSYRLDFGLSIQRSSFSAKTILRTIETDYNDKKTEYITVFDDNNVTTNYNPFITFTYNTAFQSPINFVASAGYFSQSLIGFGPSAAASDFINSFYGLKTKYVTTDLRVNYTQSFILLSPGISFDFAERARAVFTLKILKPFISGQTFDQWLYLPSFQLDFEL